ncbi:hypothetical protein MIR68_006104 [Amoeboaphelidium protococcarum]|nr:hypothetical protein MIR68_006104 [Amoeboaphelidium protococcarum]
MNENLVRVYTRQVSTPTQNKQQTGKKNNGTIRRKGGLRDVTNSTPIVKLPGKVDVVQKTVLQMDTVQLKDSNKTKASLNTNNYDDDKYEIETVPPKRETDLTRIIHDDDLVDVQQIVESFSKFKTYSPDFLQDFDISNLKQLPVDCGFDFDVSSVHLLHSEISTPELEDFELNIEL